MTNMYNADGVLKSDSFLTQINAGSKKMASSFLQNRKTVEGDEELLRMKGDSNTFIRMFYLMS